MIYLEESIIDYYGYNFFEENQRLISNMLENIKESNEIKAYFENVALLCKELDRGYKKISAYSGKHHIETINWGSMALKKDVTLTEDTSLYDVCEYMDYSTFNDLEKFFFTKKHNLLTKWLHYFEIYHRHFQKYRNKPITVLEIGVYGGGSMQMWKDYFGPDVRIIGIDINPKCKEYEDDQIEIYIGSQEDREFLNQLKKEIGSVDILIDDGGHTMNQQIVTFEELYDWISEDGIYLCEDVHTSYWDAFGGGFQKSNTFVEYSKSLIDKLNAWHSESKELFVDSFAQSTHSMHYYDSIIVIEKERRIGL